MKNRYGVAILVLAFASEASNAAELKPETLKAWDGFVQMANSHMEKRLQAGGHFLWMDEAPDRRSRVRAGEILVSPVGENNPKRVPSGLIHDWIGAAFIPNATLDDVFAVLRNYSRYKEFYRPTVIEAKSLTQVGTNDKFTLLLLNKSLLSKTALDSEYAASYTQLDKKRSYSFAHTTRVQEIQDYGQASERELPPNEGHGYIWRLYSLSRLEERDGGVYIELEAIALSRDIPAALRWIVEPIVRSVSKGSLLTSLEQTQNAVRSTVELASRGTTLPKTDAVSCNSEVLCGNQGAFAKGAAQSFRQR